MQPIQLTQDHKDKLLEMCKALFPEYHNFELELNSQHDGSEGFIIYLDENNLHGEGIHWFEFCIMDLTTKMYNISDLKKESSIKQLRGYICQETDHPIDYLYEEFKKLKTN